MYLCMYVFPFSFLFLQNKFSISFQRHHLHLLQSDMKGNALADLPDLEKARGN